MHAQGILRRDGTGYATFTVVYKAMVCRPYKGEVVDAVVATVNKVCDATAAAAAFLAKHVRCSALLQMGFFADAGPLHIFVSNHVRWAFLRPACRAA